MNCPNCGMPLFISRGDCVEYECGALYGPSSSSKHEIIRLCDSPSCHEIARLRTALAEMRSAFAEVAPQVSCHIDDVLHDDLRYKGNQP
jgi:hypothetical protein